VTTVTLMIAKCSEMARRSHTVRIIANEIFTKPCNNTFFFWYVRRCSLVEAYRHSEAVIFPQTAAHSYEATQRYVPEDSSLPRQRCENIQPHKALRCFVTERGAPVFFEDCQQQTNNNRPHRIAVKLRYLIYTSNFFLVVLIQAHL
jgi:hypothetical protein